jgi:hypothetical protein
MTKQNIALTNKSEFLAILLSKNSIPFKNLDVFPQSTGVKNASIIQNGSNSTLAKITSLLANEIIGLKISSLFRYKISLRFFIF